MAKRSAKQNGASVVDALEGDEVRLPLSKLKPDASNANLHDEANITAIMGSLQMFGQVERLVVQRKGLRIIGGNGRYEAMIRSGWTECDVKLVDLNKVEADALAITLNRTAELSTWDYQQVAKSLKAGTAGGIDWSNLGWSPKEQKSIFESFQPPTPPDDFKSYGDSIVTDYCCPRCSYEWSGKPK